MLDVAWSIYRIPWTIFVYAPIGLFLLYIHRRYVTVPKKDMAYSNLLHEEFAKVSFDRALVRDGNDSMRKINFVFGQLARAHWHFTSRHSLKRDLKRLENFRYKCLEFSNDVEFYDRLCALCKRIEFITSKRYAFYDIKKKIWNKLNDRAYRRMLKKTLCE